MKIFVASDIHGSSHYINKFKKIIENEQPDQIILLGDIYYHGPRNKFPKGYNPKKVAEVLNSYKTRLVCVKGNCDAEVDQMISSFEIQKSYETTISNKSFLFVHGHKLDATNMPKNDFIFGGHTHVPVINNDVCAPSTYVNPGSLGLPKTSDGSTYAVIEDNKITIKTIKGKIVDYKEF